MNRDMLVGMLVGGLAVGGLVVSLPGASGTSAPASVSLDEGTGLPIFEVDPSWPKVPDRWKLGDVASFAVDEQNHVWLLHRPRTLPADQRAVAAPPVVEFDAAGNFVQAWGGPAEGYQWPENEHGIYVDHAGHVWIGGNSGWELNAEGVRPVSDDQVLKFTKAGAFVMQIGRSNRSGGDSDTNNLHQPADIFVYEKTNEVFVADGYGNHRVIVFDANTGAFKRMWGAFGNVPAAPPRDFPPVPLGEGIDPQHFNTVHAVRVSNDGLVYVADRAHSRVQVFTLEGTFVSQVFIRRTRFGRTARSLAFSPDASQEFLYVGGTPEILVLNRRSLEVVDSIGHANPHHMAADGDGNIYSAENTLGIQKFVFKGRLSVVSSR